MARKSLGRKKLGEIDESVSLKGWEPWVSGGENRREWGRENRSIRSCCPPSVSSWARPPPGTSCRKSLRRQKSRRGLVLLKHCNTAFRKHCRSSRNTAVTFPDGCPAGLRASLLSPECLPLALQLFPPPTPSHVPFTEKDRKMALTVFPRFRRPT